MCPRRLVICQIDHENEDWQRVLPCSTSIRAKPKSLLNPSHLLYFGKGLQFVLWDKDSSEIKAKTGRAALLWSFYKDLSMHDSKSVTAWLWTAKTQLQNPYFRFFKVPLFHLKIHVTQHAITCWCNFRIHIKSQFYPCKHNKRWNGNPWHEIMKN